MEYVDKLRENVSKNYFFTLLMSLNLTQGIWMIYLATKGMTLAQLGILEGIFHVTSFAMEIPTGIVADVFGRKVSRICGRLLSLISTLILIFAGNFYLFAISFVISALSYNFESGAGEALIYDSLKEIKEEKRYMKIAGIQEVFLQVGQVIAYLLGGYLATKGYIYAFAATAIIGLIAIFQAFTFTEPKLEFKTSNDKNMIDVFKTQIVNSINVLKENKKIGFLIVFTEIILAFGTSLFFYLQNYLKGNGYSEFKIGIMFAVSSLIGAFAASQAFKIERIIKEKGILLIMPVISVGCVWGIALTEYHYIFFILMMAVEGLIFVAMSDYINKLIPSEQRATILSFASMVFSFFMIFIFPLIGKVGDIYSLSVAFEVLAILGSILAIGNIYFLLKIKKKAMKSE